MAEGFGRFWPREHAALLRIGKASLFETHNSARAGFRKGYFTREQSERMQRLAKRSGKAATNLIRYLESLPPRQYPGKKFPEPKNPGTQEPKEPKEPKEPNEPSEPEEGRNR